MGKEEFSVESIELFAIDLDGVVYRGEFLLPGAYQFFSKSRAISIKSV